MGCYLKAPDFWFGFGSHKAASSTNPSAIGSKIRIEVFKGPEWAASTRQQVLKTSHNVATIPVTRGLSAMRIHLHVFNHKTRGRPVTTMSEATKHGGSVMTRHPDAHHQAVGRLHISLGDIHNLPTRSKFALFQGFIRFFVQCTKISFRRGCMCLLFEICEKRPFQKCIGWGGGGKVVTFLSTRAAKSAHKHALNISHGKVQNMLSDGPSFWCTSGDLHVLPSAPNQRQCRLPEIHAEKPCWGALYDPKTGLQKQWPQQWSKSGGPRGCMQVAVNRMYEAFLLGWQMYAG